MMLKDHQDPVWKSYLAITNKVITHIFHNLMSLWLMLIVMIIKWEWLEGFCQHNRRYMNVWNMATDSCTHKLKNDKIYKTSSTNTQDIRFRSSQRIPEHLCIQRKSECCKNFRVVHSPEWCTYRSTRLA